MRASIGDRTFVEFGVERLAALCDGVGVGAAAAPLLEVFQRLVQPWGKRPIGPNPRYHSNVSDDHAPFEFALGLSSGPPEVQAYVDVQSPEGTLRANTAAARTLLDSIAPTVGASLQRLREVETLFFPDVPQGPFGLWIGASWTASRGVQLKVYLNPAVRGASRAPSIVGEALGRLGFERAWSLVSGSMRLEGPSRDELGIVSIDLSASREARVKLYIRHHASDVARIDAIASLASDYHAESVAEFYRAVAGDGPYLRRPPLTELSFAGEGAERPSSVTLEFPVGSYVENDEIAADRIRGCMRAFGIPSSGYDEAIRRFATRSLRRGSGIHSHVTLRWVRAPWSELRMQHRSGPPGAESLTPRIGIYLASEAYSPISKES